MLGLWPFVRFLHVVSAMVWVGGQLTLTALLLPLIRQRLKVADAAGLMRSVGQRFGVYTLSVFLPVQVGTGALLAWREGVTFTSLTHPGYGRTLLAKLTVFALVLLASGLHGWAHGTGRKEVARALAVGSLIGSVVIVLLATALPIT
ncbi:MAG TPA: hypothetical protein VFL99_07840 [Segeticoccus sp.]|uniref:hypothetical protein n=1 Tax=Segeticoccus sp. TaxID=2706531 RepID=UPI002D804280|nr:hypothetical protein [Segeticoccus sp.]HET8600221.1 hypothetical protein [Segeticoccus sp.]